MAVACACLCLGPHIPPAWAMTSPSARKISHAYCLMFEHKSVSLGRLEDRRLVMFTQYECLDIGTEKSDIGSPVPFLCMLDINPV